MKLPNIGIDDIGDFKNKFSLNAAKKDTSEKLSKMIVNALGIRPQDLKEAPEKDDNSKKTQSTLDKLLVVSMSTDQRLREIKELLKQSVKLASTPSKTKIPAPKALPANKASGNVTDAYKGLIMEGTLGRTPLFSPRGYPEGYTPQKPEIPAPKASPVEQPPTPDSQPGGMSAAGVAAAGALATRAPILLGAAAADTALGFAGVGGKEINDVQDEENWKRMSAFQKAQSGFARGVEKVGTVFGMGNMANEARYQRVANETNYFRKKDAGIESGTFLPSNETEAARQGRGLSAENPIFAEKPQGLAQVLDAQEAERKRKQLEAANTGPARALFEQKRAEVNQAADYNAAGETMSAAGYTTVTGRAALKPGSKEMQAADFEQAQQAQAAREAVGRGLRQRRGKEGEVPIPPRPDTVEAPQVTSKRKSYEEIYQEELNLQKGFGTEEQQQARAAQAARLRYRSQDSSQQNEPSNVQPVKSSAPPQDRDVQNARKEVRDAQQRGAELRDVAAAQGMTGKVSGTYEGGQLTKVRDESGREVDVSDRLTAEQRRNVNAAREIRAANQRSSEMQNEVTQASAENRDLNREAPAGQIQPVVIQNNNNMASQNFIPTPAQPRVQSSFSRYQERSAAY